MKGTSDDCLSTSTVRANTTPEIGPFLIDAGLFEEAFETHKKRGDYDWRYPHRQAPPLRSRRNLRRAVDHPVIVFGRGRGFAIAPSRAQQARAGFSPAPDWNAPGAAQGRRTTRQPDPPLPLPRRLARGRRENEQPPPPPGAARCRELRRAPAIAAPLAQPSTLGLPVAGRGWETGAPLRQGWAGHRVRLRAGSVAAKTSSSRTTSCAMLSLDGRHSSRHTPPSPLRCPRAP